MAENEEQNTLIKILYIKCYNYDFFYDVFIKEGVPKMFTN